jgi:hypothetical protein
MSTLNIILLVVAAVLGLAWWMRRKNRIEREKRMGR